MATFRDNPYGGFNFRVTAHRFCDAGAVRAGFQEVSGLGMESTVAEYRNGNDAENHVSKINTDYKVTDVTLKRGLAGATDFFAVHVFGIHTSLRLAPAGYVIAVASTGTLMATAFGIVIL